MPARTAVMFLLLALAAASPGMAQSLGTFRWQLQPYCNVITVRVTQIGSTYTLDGTDDLCGASPSAAATGMAFVNPVGSIGFGLTLVVPPGPVPVHLNATIDVASLSGTWQDSAGNTGAFVFNPASAPGGPTRPPARQVLGGGLSLGGSAITDVGTPVNLTDAATKGYVDATVAGATGSLATQAFVTNSIAAAMNGAILVTAGPASFVPFTSSDPLTFTYFSSVTHVARAGSGSNFLSVQPTIPTALYGRTLRLRGVQFCYTASSSATLTYAEVNTTTATAAAGGRTLRLSDPTPRSDAACRYYALPTPYTLTAADGVNFFIQVAWSAADAPFMLGRTTFVLEPTTTPVVVPTLAPDSVTVLSPVGADAPSTGAPPPPARKQ